MYATGHHARMDISLHDEVAAVILYKVLFKPFAYSWKRHRNFNTIMAALL